MWLLLMVTVLITYLIQRFRLTMLPPSSCSLLLGIVVGVFSRWACQGRCCGARTWGRAG